MSETEDKMWASLLNEIRNAVAEIRVAEHDEVHLHVSDPDGCPTVTIAMKVTGRPWLEKEYFEEDRD